MGQHNNKINKTIHKDAHGRFKTIKLFMIYRFSIYMSNVGSTP